MQSKFINTLDEVLENLPVQMTTELAVVDPFFANAERSYLISLISKQQFLALLVIYNNAGKKTADIQDEIIREAVILFQKIIVSIGYYNAVPVISVKIGTSGIQVFSNQDTKQAFNWQVDELKKSLLDLGYGAIEDLLLLMQESPDKFPEYIASDQFVSAERFLIENATDFDLYFRINRSRYIFVSIAYIIFRIESQTAKKVFGSEFFESLKSDDLTGKYITLVNDYIKPGIALLVAEKALKERVITFENGVASINLIGNYDAAKSNIAASQLEIKAMSDQLLTDGNQFLQDGLEYINENRGDFLDYVPPASRKRYNIKNDPTGGLFAT